MNRISDLIDVSRGTFVAGMVGLSLLGLLGWMAWWIDEAHARQLARCTAIGYTEVVNVGGKTFCAKDEHGAVVLTRMPRS